MSDRPWWAIALQWSLWLVLMSAVMAWLGRSRMRARPAAQTTTLAHPPSTLIVGLVGFGFFAGIAVLSNVYRNRTTTWWTTAIFVGLAALSLPLILDYFIARHTLSDDGLNYRTMLGARRHLRWSDLLRVSYSDAMKWFVLRGRDGSVARISAMLMGLPEFARLLLERAPAGAIDSRTMPILEATAQGQPPSVWR